MYFVVHNALVPGMSVRVDGDIPFKPHVAVKAYDDLLHMGWGFRTPCLTIFMIGNTPKGVF